MQSTQECICGGNQKGTTEKDEGGKEDAHIHQSCHPADHEQDQHFGRRRRAAGRFRPEVARGNVRLMSKGTAPSASGSVLHSLA